MGRSSKSDAEDHSRGWSGGTRRPGAVLARPLFSYERFRNRIVALAQGLHIRELCKGEGVVLLFEHEASLLSGDVFRMLPHRGHLCSHQLQARYACGKQTETAYIIYTTSARASGFMGLVLAANE